MNCNGTALQKCNKDTFISRLQSATCPRKRIYSLGVLIGCDVRLLWLDADPGRLAKGKARDDGAHAGRHEQAGVCGSHLLALDIDA